VLNINSIFITKNLAEIPALTSFCQTHQLQLQAQSFITFEPVSAVFRLPAQVYFFSSKNGVDFFLQQHIIEATKKIACVGEATKQHLEFLGYPVDFCGEESGNPTEVGIQLNFWLEDRRVAFICSDISRKTVAKQIPENQKEEVVFYRTKIHSSKLNEQYACYVFTSPSNVKGFLKVNNLPYNVITIAWGKTTEEAMRKNQITPTKVLKNSSFDELQNYLEKIM
jgi:uroporphyrinogen-III synthase